MFAALKLNLWAANKIIARRKLLEARVLSDARRDLK